MHGYKVINRRFTVTTIFVILVNSVFLESLKTGSDLRALQGVKRETYTSPPPSPTLNNIDDLMLNKETIEEEGGSAIDNGGFASNFHCDINFNTNVKGVFCTGIALPGSAETEPGGWRACQERCSQSFSCGSFVYRESDQKCSFMGDDSCPEVNQGFVSGPGKTRVDDCTSCVFSAWGDWVAPCIAKKDVPGLEPPSTSNQQVNYRNREVTGYHYRNEPMTGDECYKVQTRDCIDVDGELPDDSGYEPDSSNMIIVACAGGGLLLVLLLGVYGYKKYNSNDEISYQDAGQTQPLNYQQGMQYPVDPRAQPRVPGYY